MKNYFLALLTFCCSITLSAQDLYDIARSGTVGQMQEAYAQNPESVNLENSSGYTPLTLAVYHGNLQVVDFLIPKVKSINEVSSYGTPLMAAVVKGRLEIVKLLLENGADPNITDSQRNAPLTYAAVFKLNDIAQLLLEYKANVGHKDNKGYTPLDYAKLTNNNELITLITKAK